MATITCKANIKIENDRIKSKSTQNVNTNTRITFDTVTNLKRVGMIINNDVAATKMYLDLESIIVTFNWPGKLRMIIKQGTEIVDSYTEIDKLSLVFIEPVLYRTDMGIRRKGMPSKVFDDVVKYNITFTE